MSPPSPTYDYITCAIDLYSSICMFQIKNKEKLGTDSLTREDWDELKRLAVGFKAIHSAHGSTSCSARKRITAEPNQLAGDITQACVCLKS